MARASQPVSASAAGAHLVEDRATCRGSLPAALSQQQRSMTERPSATRSWQISEDLLGNVRFSPESSSCFRSARICGCSARSLETFDAFSELCGSQDHGGLFHHPFSRASGRPPRRLRMVMGECGC